MKLATFTHNNLSRVGAVIDDIVIDSLSDANIPNTMIDFLSAGANALLAMQELIDSGLGRFNLADVKLNAPIPRPGKYLGISLNYADHITETGAEQPKYPSFFTKQSTCVIGHDDFIHQPKVSDKLDYEGELAFVIGKRCRHVPVEKAHQVPLLNEIPEGIGMFVIIISFVVLSNVLNVSKVLIIDPAEFS